MVSHFLFYKDFKIFTRQMSYISHLNKRYAIIVAGGSGTRMGAAIPKQFLLLNGLPVLMHTLLAFHNSQSKPDLILVLPAAYHEYWTELCKRHNFDLPHQLVSGGETRFHSVKKGLDLISADEPGLIAVQDAVRPLTSAEIIDAAYESAARQGNGVVAIKSRDSIRRLKNEISVALNRDEISTWYKHRRPSNRHS